MKKVVVFCTGGTITGIKDKYNELIRSGGQTGEQLLAQYDTKIFYKHQIAISIHTPFQIASNHMNFSMCLSLIRHMHNCYKQNIVDGFVILHGTDTLEESAYCLSLLWDKEIPVVFTGAQINPEEKYTDAFQNLSDAILVAGNDRTRKKSVFVVFNQNIMSASDTQKIHASGIHGFASPISGNLGFIDRGSVHYYVLPLPYKRIHIPSQIRKRVEIIKVYMDMDPKIFDHFLTVKVDGLIIEAFGRGNIPPNCVSKIKNLADQKIPIVITTACPIGEVADVYDFPGSLHNLMQYGVISGGTHDAKKARIKLLLLLENAISLQEIAQAFALETDE